MDNQHRKTTGYRDFTPEELALINEIKLKAEEVGELFKRLDDAAHLTGLEAANAETPSPSEQLAEQIRNGLVRIDARWLNIARTDMQKSFMFFVRAVARPTTF